MMVFDAINEKKIKKCLEELHAEICVDGASRGTCDAYWMLVSAIQKVFPKMILDPFYYEGEKSRDK